MDETQAHAFSIRHRRDILASEQCGCFYCLAQFAPQAIREWIDDEQDVGQTALCPKCGIDSVVGSASGVPITRAFLECMYVRWFKTEGLDAHADQEHGDQEEQ
jgi:hypothetical protein